MIQPNRIAGTLLISLFVLILPVVCSGQDRDITGGSSMGSIRSDVSELPSGPRRRMLTPENRAALVAEFELFRGAEALLNAPSFEALKDKYAAALEKVAAQKPIATDLTPLKYLVFELMAEDLSQKKTGINADVLAEEMISSYVKTRDFMPPLLHHGVSKQEATISERNAVAALHQITRQRTGHRPAVVAPAASGPKVGTTTISYGVNVNDRPRDANAGVAKRKGILAVNIRVGPQFVFGITNDTFSSKKRSDGTYITGIGNTTPSLKYEAIYDTEKHPSLTLTYSITLPTASVAKTLGTGRVDHKILADIGKTVRATQLTLSLGYLFAGRKNLPGFSKTGLAVLSLAHPIGERFRSTNEIDLATRADTTPSEIYSINQIVYKVSDTLSIRAGLRTGITVNSPRIGFTGGLTITTSLGKIFR